MTPGGFPMTEDTKLRPFKRLETNFKGSSSVDIGPNTVIVGANQRGKTALIDAIHAAIMGKHPAVRGGPGVANRWLDAFAPPDQQSLEAVLQGPQGNAVFKVWKEGRTAKMDHSPGPLLGMETPIPDLVLADVLLKEGNTMQNELIRRWGEGAAADAPEGASEDMQALWSSTVQEVLGIKSAPSDTELLAEVVSALGRKVKALGNRIGESRRRIEGVDPSTFSGTEMIAQLEQELENTKRYAEQEGNRQVIETYDQQQVALAEAKQQLEQLQAARDANAEQRSAWAGQQAAAKKEIAAQRNALSEERAALASKANFSSTILGLLNSAQSGDSCVLCGSPADNAALAKLVGDRLGERNDQIQQVDAKVADLQRQEQEIDQAVRQAEAAWAAADQPVVDLAQWIVITEASLDRQRQSIERLRHQQAPSAPGRTREQLEHQIRELREKKQAKEAHTAEQSRIVQLEAEQDLVKRLEKLAKRKAKNFAEAAAVRAEAVANLYATPGMSIVYDRKANVWQIGGATRDGRPHGKTASGFERMLLLPALFLAWTHEQPRFCVLDDTVTGTYDARHQKELLAVLKGRQEAGDIVQNFVVLPPAMVEHPELDDITAGWTRIDL